jgi:predicted acyltransferase
MTGEICPVNGQRPDRILSIDVLRGLTILVMIFVNDVAGVKDAPSWMKHFYPYEADGMTFVDVVFPAFLFIVGMAIPFSLGRRFERGDPALKIWKHILIRTLGLLAIGVCMVNSYSVSDKGRMNPNLWTFLMYLAVILVWNTPPREPDSRRRIVVSLRWLGVLLLVVLTFLYRGGGEKQIIEMRPQWWGILGLIGWAYLVACLAYTFLRRNLAGMMGVSALLYCVFMADRAGFFSGFWLDRWVDFGSMLGSLAAITVSGVVLGMVLSPDSPVKTHCARIRWAFFYSWGLALAGRLLYSLHDIHEMFIVNKNAATAPWCLYSSAVTVWVWMVIYYIMDVKGWIKWSVLLGPVGENPLFAYILQKPMLYAGFSLLVLILGGFDFYACLGNSFSVGFVRAILFAFGVTLSTGALKRAGIHLKL